MKIGELIGPERVIADLRVRDKARALERLAERAAADTGLDVRSIATALASREELGSTGVGQGVAIPHARIKGLTQPFALFARLRSAIDFAAVDEKPVDLIFLLLLPELADNDHLAALACISRVLRDRTTADRLRTARNAKGTYAILTETL